MFLGAGILRLAGGGGSLGAVAGGRIAVVDSVAASESAGGSAGGLAVGLVIVGWAGDGVVVRAVFLGAAVFSVSGVGSWVAAVSGGCCSRMGSVLGVGGFFMALPTSDFFGGGTFSWAASGVMTRAALAQAWRRYLNMGWVGGWDAKQNVFLQRSYERNYYHERYSKKRQSFFDFLMDCWF